VVLVAVPGGSIAEALDLLTGVEGEEAREVVEQLNRDAGYDPVYTGPLENAARQESIIDVIFAIGEGMGEYVYRFAPIEQL
jgi:predicted dinucleotide-binding enzyme